MMKEEKNSPIDFHCGSGAVRSSSPRERRRIK
jgi:hypothetical protein